MDEPWKKEEVILLFKEHMINGNKWAIISEKLPGRTPNAVKNMFCCKLKKLARIIKNGLCEINDSKSEDQIMQDAYILNYLYTTYIDQKQIPKEKTMGCNSSIDQIILSTPIQHFRKYLSLFISQIPREMVPQITYKYPSLMSLTNDNSSNSATIPYCPIKDNNQDLPKQRKSEVNQSVLIPPFIGQYMFPDMTLMSYFNNFNMLSNPMMFDIKANIMQNILYPTQASLKPLLYGYSFFPTISK